MADEMKDKPVVMFCTGGIRCEKASVVMMDAGFSNVKQLKGGILGYFEEVGGDYWQGDCFVFDRRGIKSKIGRNRCRSMLYLSQPLLVEEQNNRRLCNRSILSILC